MKGEKLPKGVTAEQIEEWRKKYPNSQLFEFKGEVDGKAFSCICRSPDRPVIHEWLKTSNPSKQGQIMIQNCVLTNKEEVLEKDDLYFGVQSKLSEFVPSLELEAVKI